MNTTRTIYKAIGNAAQSASGMTLIDMAIALMVIGILATPMIYSYNQWHRQQVIEQNDARSILPSQVAINQFYQMNNRYPCPALPNLGPGDDGYGVENCTAQPLPNGTLGQGGNILVGAVPFATLKIPAEVPLDSYKNKLTYMVTKAQTVPPVPGNAAPEGTINVFGYNLPCGSEDSPHNLTNHAHFALIMHGEKGIGAYNLHGDRPQACRADTDTSRTEEDTNCDNDDKILASTCSYSLGDGPMYFDDRVYTQDAFNSVMWSNVPQDVSQSDILTRSAEVGINIDSPGKTLDVAGNLLVTPDQDNEMGIDKAQVKSDVFCHWAAEFASQAQPWLPQGACFDPDMIAGADPQMDCATSSYGENSAFAGIVPNGNVGYGKADCKLRYVATGTSRECPNGQHMTGIDGDGNIQCAP